MSTPAPPSRPLPTDFVHAGMHARPWMSLFYLAFVFVPLMFWGAAPARAWIASLVAMAVFVPLYLSIFRLPPGRREWGIPAVAALGFVLMPFNPGGNTFLIYAMALAGSMLAPRLAIAVTAALMVLMTVQLLWLVDSGGFGLPMTLMTAVIGTLVLSGTLFDRAQAQRNADLRLSQEEVRRLARLAERERIGRDLHDLLGHTLSLVALKSELAARLIERDPGAARQHVQEVEQVARQALAQVREAVTGIRAASLEAELASARLALLHADVALADELAAPPLRAEVEAALALVLREAITNVVRHARAQRVEVELGVEAGSLHLRIADDGRGGVGAPGNGLSGMRERAAAIGATLAIDSPAGAGTRIDLRVAEGWRAEGVPDAEAAA